MGGVSFLPEFPLGGFVVEITRKDTPPCSFPPIHNFQLYLRTDDIDIEEVQRRIDEQYALIEEMQQWLDKQLKN
jgi:hypothetical protein